MSSQMGRCTQMAAHARLASAGVRSTATSLGWDPLSPCAYDPVQADRAGASVLSALRSGSSGKGSTKNETGPAQCGARKDGGRRTDALPCTTHEHYARSGHSCRTVIGSCQPLHEGWSASHTRTRSLEDSGVLVVELGPQERFDLEHDRREAQRGGIDSAIPKIGGADGDRAEERQGCAVVAAGSSASGATCSPLSGLSGRQSESCLSPGTALRLPDFSGLWPAHSAGAVEFELCAVPKRRVTPSRKGLRSGNRKLKLSRAAPRVLYKCTGCGRLRLPHHVCYYCIKMNAKQRPVLEEMDAQPM